MEVFGAFVEGTEYKFQHSRKIFVQAGPDGSWCGFLGGVIISFIRFISFRAIFFHNLCGSSVYRLVSGSSVCMLIMGECRSNAFKFAHSLVYQEVWYQSLSVWDRDAFVDCLGNARGEEAIGFHCMRNLSDS